MSVPVLPEDRWQGIWSPEPMRRLADGYGVVAARSGETPPLNDYDAIDVSILPFLAWQNHAVAYYVNGSETSRREALRLVRELNRLQGTEGGIDVLISIHNTRGRVVFLAQTYEGTPYLRRKNVDVVIEEPPGETVGADLLGFLFQTMAKMLPYTLQLRRVLVTSALHVAERHYVATRGIDRGWIVDGEQWP